MDRITPVPVNPAFVRAVLVCHFPERFTKESVVPRLREFGVDILRTVNVERSPDFKVGDAEIVICMKDFISHNAWNTARSVARKHSRPFVAITRKAAEWEEKFAKIKQEKLTPRTKLQLVTPAPASSRAGAVVEVEETIPAPPDSEPAEAVEEMGIEQYKELLGMFELENVRLEGENKHLMKRLEDSDKLAGGLERQLEVSKKSQRTAEQACQQAEKVVNAASAELEKVRGERDRLRAELTTTERDLTEACARAAKAAPIDKSLLLTWVKLLHAAKAGSAPDFHALLEFSAKADISTAELLTLLKG